MDVSPSLFERYDRPVPRYTSYPTAPHFTTDVDAALYRRWKEPAPSCPAHPPSPYFRILA